MCDPLDSSAGTNERGLAASRERAGPLLALTHTPYGTNGTVSV